MEMISRDHVQRLIERPTNGRTVLSAFLDMSVNSDNKRTYRIFLNKEKASHQELDSDREGKHREALGEAFARLEQWIDANFQESNKGVAVFVELDGGWTQGFQFPLPVPNRVVLDTRPVVGPLVEIISRYHHHGVILIDREQLRLLSYYLDETIHEKEVRADPFPAPHDVRRGGFSAPDYQARKEEETRHFFKEFAAEVEDFVRRHSPDDLSVLGTHENVARFVEYLPQTIQGRIIHTDGIEIDATPSEIRRKLAPAFQRRIQEEEARSIDLLRGRVEQSHLAVAGFEQTLEQLQAGKVQTLVVARGVDQKGGQCQQCGFLFASPTDSCNYCAGPVRDQVDLVEEMLRLAGDQDLTIDFVPPAALADIGNVGGLLRF
jgi:peptide chain release factor subunit 1